MPSDRGIPETGEAALAEAAYTDPPAALIRHIGEDARMRSAVASLLRSRGYDAASYSDPTQFLERDAQDRAGCIILDVWLPGRNGLDLQRELIERGCRTPLIFLTAHGDIQMAVQAMRAGAIDFLAKPLRPQGLLDAIDRALLREEETRAERLMRDNINARLAGLTTREIQVLRRVCAGVKNRPIAHELGIKEITVKIHRSRGFRKLGGPSIATVARWLELSAA